MAAARGRAGNTLLRRPAGKLWRGGCRIFAEAGRAPPPQIGILRLYSTARLYSKKSAWPWPCRFLKSGGSGWIRTIVAEKQQIYSLPPLAAREHSHISAVSCRFAGYCSAAGDGAGGRIRTPDLLITNQLLYRLSYTSITIPRPNNIPCPSPNVNTSKVEKF